MPRPLACLLAAIIVLSAATTSQGEPAQDPARRKPSPVTHIAKRRPHQIWHGYGFLPGYRTPERIAWDNAHARGPQWWYGPPRWYRGQWNHGGFGPCYTETPIGEIWNCGK